MFFGFNVFNPAAETLFNTRQAAGTGAETDGERGDSAGLDSVRVGVASATFATAAGEQADLEFDMVEVAGLRPDYGLSHMPSGATGQVQANVVVAAGGTLKELRHYVLLCHGKALSDDERGGLEGDGPATAAPTVQTVLDSPAVVTAINSLMEDKDFPAVDPSPPPAGLARLQWVIDSQNERIDRLTTALAAAEDGGSSGDDVATATAAATARTAEVEASLEQAQQRVAGLEAEVADLNAALAAATAATGGAGHGNGTNGGDDGGSRSVGVEVWGVVGGVL